MENVKHWAESLQSGDRVTGTIRHKTDGNLNRHNVEMIVAEVIPEHKQVLAVVYGFTIYVPFNELNKP